MLTRDEEYLIQQAREAANNAYCPYSRFAVGAACESEIGIVTGCNVENASYGLAMCAERVALFAARSRGAKRVTRMAVACISVQSSAAPEERMCCGACRQVMSEMMEHDAIVLIDGVGAFTLQGLLPMSFRLQKQDLTGG